MTVIATTVSTTTGAVTLGDDANARIASLTTLSKNNLAAAMWAVMSTRSTGLSEQVATLMTGIATRNEKMKALNQAIADCIKAKAPPNADAANVALQDGYIATYRAELDSYNSTQQMDMVKLQDMMSKNGETSSLLSAVLKLIADQNQGVVQKM